MVNGRADYPIPQEIGYHEFKVRYNGTYTTTIKDRFAYINVIPKVITPKPVNINENYNINIICNDNSNNTMKVELKNYNTGEIKSIYDGVQTSKLFTKEELNLKSAGYYQIIATFTFNNTEQREYNCGSLDIRDTPRQFKINAEINDVNLNSMTTSQFNTASSCAYIPNIPSDGNGTVSLYLNDKLVATGDKFSNYLYFATNLLKKGNNKVVIKYTDDMYYSDSTFT